ncbi:hypothetical protein [Roseococcus sp. YIM B11640]|uniref:hypothetical protein n=1 Tax=Roseococcus sp. YIM B11640 TaxID=3133973 RepID=UPI003C7D2A68
MPRSFLPDWLAFESLENEEHNRCLDLLERADGTLRLPVARCGARGGGRMAEEAAIGLVRAVGLEPTYP